MAAALKVERPLRVTRRVNQVKRPWRPGAALEGRRRGLGGARQEREEREGFCRGRMMQLGWGMDGRGCGACSFDATAQCAAGSGTSRAASQSGSGQARRSRHALPPPRV